MKNFNELNYYDMLQIPANASDFDIRQAYKETLSIYDEDSSVTYSLFSDEERKEILENIEYAFSTLIDKNARSDYDKTLVKSGQINESDLIKTDRQKLVSIFSKRGSNSSKIPVRKIERMADDKEVKELVKTILSNEKITGKDLKKLREAMCIELEDIYEATRISVSVLKNLEEDNIKMLPSGGYIKNFLRMYAEYLRIDSNKVTEGYLKNINESGGIVDYQVKPVHGNQLYTF